jgi:hypothetical protein
MWVNLYQIRVDYPLFGNKPLQGAEFAEKRTKGNKERRGVMDVDLVLFLPNELTDSLHG